MTKIIEGSFKPRIEVKGPFAETFKDVPEAWFYRIGQKVELHVQVNTKRGLEHFIFTIPARRKKR